MRTTELGPGTTLINRQDAAVVSTASLKTFTRRLKQRMKLGKRGFTICLMGDAEIRRLNRSFRGNDKATDVLSFPWVGRVATSGRNKPIFLGDIAISVETATRNARREGHSALNEIRWLILHGVLHLLGYDHATDNGEMTRLELEVRDELRVGGKSKSNSNGKRQIANGKDKDTRAGREARRRGGRRNRAI